MKFKNIEMVSYLSKRRKPKFDAALDVVSWVIIFLMVAYGISFVVDIVVSVPPIM